MTTKFSVWCITSGAALVAFLATIAFARFAERRKVRSLEDSPQPGETT